MTYEVPFVKMHGAGNDYVYVDCTAGGRNAAVAADTDAWIGFVAAHAGELARLMSCRHTGVGADGLVLVMPSAVADVRMRIFNADGSEAEMCGNASRCVGKLAYERGLIRGARLLLETGSGVKRLALDMDRNGRVRGARVDMGGAELSDYGDRSVVEAGGFCLGFTAVSMGNPHCVCFVDELSDRLVLGAGPLIECDARFAGRTNVEFVRVESRRHVVVRVWERGSGETQACGTGACASVVAAVSCGLCDADADVAVDMPGGRLFVRWERESNRVLLSGPAVEVFGGVCAVNVDERSGAVRIGRDDAVSDMSTNCF